MQNIAICTACSLYLKAGDDIIFMHMLELAEMLKMISHQVLPWLTKASAGVSHGQLAHEEVLQFRSGMQTSKPDRVGTGLLVARAMVVIYSAKLAVRESPFSKDYVIDRQPVSCLVSV